MIRGKKRLLLLGVMIVILFVNWYHYKTVDTFFREVISTSLESIEATFPSLAFLGKFNSIVRKLSLVLLSAINISISLTIIYIYFLEWKMVKQAFKLLIGFAIACFISIIYNYYYGSKDFLDTSLFALNQLATPLVECTLIPLLKLMNAQPETPTNTSEETVEDE